jgi:hypothetical protein
LADRPILAIVIKAVESIEEQKGREIEAPCKRVIH